MSEQQIPLTSGLSINALIEGDPSHPPLVLIHGWPSSAYLWRHMMPELARHFYVIAPDLPGHGKSDKPSTAEYDLNFLRGFILGVFEAFNLKTANLACHDLGGMAGLSFAVRHPERLEKLIVMDTSPYADWPFLLHLAIFLLKQKNLTPFFLNRFVFRLVLKTGFYNKALITSEVLDLFREPWIRSPEGQTAFSQTIAIPPDLMVESEEKLKTIQAPTLILWGTKDWFFPFRTARRLHKDIKNSTLVAVEKAGHFLQEEQPEFICRQMIAFLKPN